MSFEDNTDRIEQYLNGQLSVAEKAAFEKEMSENAELSEEVELLRLLPKAIQLHEEKKIREHLKELEKNIRAEEVIAEPGSRAAASIPPPGGISGSSGIKYAAVAASIALLIGLFFLFKDSFIKTPEQFALTPHTESRVAVMEIPVTKIGGSGFGFISDTTQSRLLVAVSKPSVINSTNIGLFGKLYKDTIFLRSSELISDLQIFEIDTTDVTGTFMQMSANYYQLEISKDYKPLYPVKGNKLDLLKAYTSK